MVHGERPEHTAPPDVFYNDTEARKYTTNSRIMNIQRQLTERAMELLCLPDDGQPKLLLDLGCGSGLSGETLEEVRLSSLSPPLSFFYFLLTSNFLFPSSFPNLYMHLSLSLCLFLVFLHFAQLTKARALLDWF